MTTPGRSLSSLKPQRHAVTLLELLAVIVLFSLIGGAILAHAGNTAHHATRHELLMQLQQLDRAARQFARTQPSGPVTMLHGANAVTIDCTATDRRLRQLAIPPQLSLTIRESFGAVTVDQSISSLVFDLQGRSRDYRVSVCCDDGCSSMTIHGLTGMTSAANDAEGEAER